MRTGLQKGIGPVHFSTEQSPSFKCFILVSMKYKGDTYLVHSYGYFEFQPEQRNIPRLFRVYMRIISDGTLPV